VTTEHFTLQGARTAAITESPARTGRPQLQAIALSDRLVAH
jgi:hypothetical protein